MGYDFAVIGANGMQGKIAARDLLESGYSVLLCANDRLHLDPLLKKFQKKVRYTQIDLRKIADVKKKLNGTGISVLINCAVDDYNLAVTKLAAELNVHLVDLGSEIPMYKEQEKLDPLFKKKNLVAISGAGSTPGINNVMLRHVADRFDTIHTVHIGFVWDSNMEVFLPPFSMDAITYEFEDPAVVFENGTFTEKLPTMPTKLDHVYMEIGKQAVHHTKHVEHYSVAKNLKHKGVKNVMVYGGFPEYSYNTIVTLLKNGFLSKKLLMVDSNKIRPIDATIEVLRQIPIPKGYIERENLWVKVYGTKGGKKHVEEMDCIAKTIPGWEEATCNIDTGFPISIMAQMVKNGEITGNGFHSPETIVPPKPFFKHLGKKKIYVYDNGRKIN